MSGQPLAWQYQRLSDPFSSDSNLKDGDTYMLHSKAMQLSSLGQFFNKVSMLQSKFVLTYVKSSNARISS